MSRRWILDAQTDPAWQIPLAHLVELLSWMLLMFCSFSRRNEDAMVDAPNLIVVKKSMRAELF